MIVLLMSTPKRNMAAAMTSWARNSAEALLFADWWTVAGRCIRRACDGQSMGKRLKNHGKAGEKDITLNHI